jgi:metal-responsive CopG/Arc/MetJ family transcriptional regulator
MALYQACQEVLGTVKSLNKPVTLSLPQSLLELIERVRVKRRDPTRSDTVRVLLLQALGSMDYLPGSEKRALGIKIEEVSK